MSGGAESKKRPGRMTGPSHEEDWNPVYSSDLGETTPSPSLAATAIGSRGGSAMS